MVFPGLLPPFGAVEEGKCRTPDPRLDLIVEPGTQVSSTGLPLCVPSAPSPQRQLLASLALVQVAAPGKERTLCCLICILTFTVDTPRCQSSVRRWMAMERVSRRRAARQTQCAS